MNPEIYFSQIREDSIVERQITATYQPNRIVVIGSGGCTALSILNDHVDVVYCIDINPAQCALIELKKVAMRFIGNNIRKNVYGDEIWQALFHYTTLQEQKEFFEKYLTTEAWKTALRVLLSKTTHLQFFPSFMFANAREDDFGLFFSHQFEKELHSKLVYNSLLASSLSTFKKYSNIGN